MITMIEHEEGFFEIQLPQTFDFESHKEFRKSIKDAMNSTPSMLSLNFTKVEYLDSSALGMLMLAKHETDAMKCGIKIINLKDGHARKVLELVKFDQIFTIEYA